MPEIWFIGDTHFGHRNMVNFLREDGSKLRPWATVEEMDEAIVSNWNSVVSHGDRVYHLGDFAMSKRNIAIVRRLNGRKVLIKGNHDNADLAAYGREFEDIRGAYAMKNGWILTHIPVHPDCIEFRFKLNVHGHLHAKNVMLNGERDKRYFNVSVECINFTPITLHQIEKAIMS